MGAISDTIPAAGKKGTNPLLALIVVVLTFMGGGAAGSGISSSNTGERLAALEARMEGVQKTLEEIKAELRSR